jgi:hypothetical protein
MINYKNKYMKYKNKYTELKLFTGGTLTETLTSKQGETPLPDGLGALVDQFIGTDAYMEINEANEFSIFNSKKKI